MKKLIVFILVASMMLISLVACSDDGEEPSSKPATSQSGVSAAESSTPDLSTEESSEETSIDPYEHLRGIDLGGREINILVYDDTNGRYKSVEICEHEDGYDAINNAIVDRNEIVENLLNCKIKEVRVANVLTSARTDILGDGAYDIIMPYMPYAATLASEGSLVDLTELEELKLDQPYWDQRANENLSIGNRLFFTTGDLSLLTFDCTHATVFNKTMVADNASIEDPYTLLKENRWTLDTMLANARLATADTDGESGMTFKDTWGLFINEGYATTMFMGSGERLTKKDSNDYPQISVNTERAVDVTEKIRGIFNDDKVISIESYVGSLGGTYSDVYYAATAATGENRALFRTLAIVDLQELTKDFNCAFGILPTPKYDESQEEYYNIVSAILASCVCIHNNVADVNESAAVAEALACASTDTVRKAYYDVILKSRQIPDEEGEFALDIIFDNRVYEMATIFSFSSLGQFITTCAKSTADIFTSEYTRIVDTVQSAIDDTIAAFEDA